MAEGVNDNGIDRKDKDRIGMVLFIIYIFFLIAAVIVVGRIVYLQVFYRPDPAFVREFTPRSIKEITEPERGAILSSDGKLLAASIPMYQIAMDCTVRKEEFMKIKSRETGEEKEAEWLEKAKALSEGLAELYGDRTAGEYYDMIASARRNDRKYIRIGGLINHMQLHQVKALPLFDEGKYKGGIIVEKYE